MNVYIQNKEYSFRYGGANAAKWSDCPRNNSKVYNEVVVPYLSSMADSRRITKRYDKIPNVGRYDPQVNNLGMMYDGDEFMPAYRDRKEEVRKSKSKHKDYVLAQERGEIVLRPMTAMNYEISMTPGVTGRLEPHDVLMYVPGDKIVHVESVGKCRSYYKSLPDIEVDVLGVDFAALFKVYRDAEFVPPDKRLASEALTLVRDNFNNVPVNSGLVTEVVAEANSQTWDVLTEMAEMPETIKMVVNGVITGVKLLLRAKREIKQNLSSGSVGKDAASIWMMYRYGLMPIIYSINDSLDYMELEAKKYQSFRGRSDSPHQLDDIGDFKFSAQASLEERVFLKYGYDLESKVTGLKLNVFSTAWELLPLSFVLDWFIQVGDTLTALSVPTNVQHVGCSFSVRDRNEYVWVNPHTNSRISVRADCYRTAPIDPQAFIGLNSDVFLSFKRKMDALSLFWLMFKKNPRG